MKLSKLNVIPSTREMISAFGGYNHNIRINEGEFYDMTNLTSAEYPSLSPRKKRGIYESPENPLGLISKDALCYVDGSDLYIDRYKIEGFELDPKTKKTLISMGAYIIIMPDKKYINTVDYSDKGNIEYSYKLTADPLYFEPCNKDGSAIQQPDGLEFIPRQKTAPTASTFNIEELPSGTYWVDTSNEPNVLKIYDAYRAMWSDVTQMYIKIYHRSWNIFEGFNAGDGITISGITKEGLTHLNTNLVIENKIETPATQTEPIQYAIVVKGMITERLEQNCNFNMGGNVTFTRNMPDMDFIIESENRLWGCKYGIVNGKMVNEIYASKLGDFKNWNCFAGISTDSYVASVGTDGEFTGAITYLGYPLFFKEDYIHKIYGNYPANFQVQTTACRGVQQGSHKSLALVNETLFYKSRYSVCAYDGALPVEMSSALGNVLYTNAVAGSHGNKYYISMKDSEDYRLFVYDTFKGMWHKEDNTEVVEFCNNRGQLFYIDRDTNQIMLIEAPSWLPDGEKEPNAVKWSAETGIIGTDSPDKKYISRLIVRLSMEYGTKVNFFADYDSLGIWEHLFTANGTSLKTFSIPIRPQRCDHLRLRIEGEGEARIFSICKVIEQGSDL